MSTAPEYLRSFVERILRMKEEQDNIGSDVRDIYAEAKAAGFDKGTLGRVVTYVRKRSKDSAAVQESDALFELYLASYDGELEQPSRTHARARGQSEPTKSAPATPKAIDAVVGLANAGGDDEVAPDRTAARADAETARDSIGKPSGAETGSDVRAVARHFKAPDAGDIPTFLIREQGSVAT